MPKGGRPRQLCSRTVLLGVMLALDSGRPAHLEAAHRALSWLSVPDQLALKVAVIDGGRRHIATYRQFEDTFSVMCRLVDPSPVPSFRGVAEPARRAHLGSWRAGVDEKAATDQLDRLVDALVEASVPEAYKSASRSLAVDWTDHETWSRPRSRDDLQPANDPDASWGHAKRNAPGAKDCLFFGYYAQVATMVADEGGAPVPELVRRIAFAAPRVDPPGLMAETLSRMGEAISLGDVIADCGYSNREPRSWARPLRSIGASLVMDLHPNDRGIRGDFEGAISANGQLYCPKTPAMLVGLGPLRRGASSEEIAEHEHRCAELARYRLSPVAAPDEDGYQRLCCPAVANKIRCLLKPASMKLSAERPSVLEPPARPLSRCCAQQTITVPPQVNEKTRQKHAYPSVAHARSYARRTAAERTYASLADPSAGGIRRGWSRLFGLAKNTLLYALAVAVRNVRVTESFERSRAEKARREALGGGTRRRRRRHQRDEPVPDEPPFVEVPTAPG